MTTQAKVGDLSAIFLIDFSFNDYLGYVLLDEHIARGQIAMHEAAVREVRLRIVVNEKANETHHAVGDLMREFERLPLVPDLLPHVRVVGL